MMRRCRENKVVEECSQAVRRSGEGGNGGGGGQRRGRKGAVNNFLLFGFLPPKRLRIPAEITIIRERKKGPAKPLLSARHSHFNLRLIFDRLDRLLLIQITPSPCCTIGPVTTADQSKLLQTPRATCQVAEKATANTILYQCIEEKAHFPNPDMLSEGFISSIRAQQKSANTAIAKDVGIYLHELNPSPTIKSSFKKSSTPVNALAVSSTHIFAAQADKAVVHVYSRERGNQEALISFPERIHCVTLVGDGVLVLGTAEGRVILWEVGVIHVLPQNVANFFRCVQDDKSRLQQHIYNRYLVWQPHNHISQPDPKIQIFMSGLYHASYL
jgi:hypothetical protein